MAPAAIRRCSVRGEIELPFPGGGGPFSAGRARFVALGERIVSGTRMDVVEVCRDLDLVLDTEVSVSVLRPFLGWSDELGGGVEIGVDVSVVAVVVGDKVK